ncbi:ROK family protein [Georgenia sp. SUBG003]|uniref:ROK family protein n=1 Tax=Georgenia sp. SUBG003 TaxID=1497974 RepID=UPI003AB551D0
MLTIGVDIGGTKIAAGVVDEDGRLGATATFPTDPTDPGAIEHAVVTAVAQLREGREVGEFAAADVFVTRSADAAASAGEGPAVGTWWGGPGRFVDFTRPAAREAWKRWLTEAVLDKGTTSVWNDNCEYDGIIDKDSRCDFDGARARSPGSAQSWRT